MPQIPDSYSEFNFSVDSSLLFQLGEQLVTKPSIALAELVKNAYDADATQVTITMENVEETGGTIIIEDDGHGMTLKEIQANWMRIATNTKREQPMSRKYHRSLTGAKGIGRFAVRRLGNRLTVQSIAKTINEDSEEETKEGIIIEFDWKTNFQPGDDLINVPIKYKRQQVSRDTPTGVSLFIEDVRDAWNEDDIAELRRDLLTVQSPFHDLIDKYSVGAENSHDPGFNIIFEIAGSNELESLSGGLGEAFVEAAWARLDGNIDENSHAHYEIDIQLTHEKDDLYDNLNVYAGLEGARLRVYYMVYRKDYFERFDFGVRDAQRKGRSEGGVRVYLDGFRVFPYGEPTDDWLQLDEFAARNIDLASEIAPPEKVLELAKAIPGRPFLNIPRNYQLFGAVAISQTMHPDIEINISRQRLIESPAEEGLRNFVQNGLYWMTMKYSAFLAEEREKRKKKTPPKTVPEILAETKQTIAATELSDEKKAVIYSSIDTAIVQAKEEGEERISEVSMLRVLASAGTTLALMNHQLRHLLTGVLQIREDLNTLRPSVSPESQEQYDDIVAQVIEWHEMVKRQVSQLGFLLSPESRQRRNRHPLYQVVEDVHKPMSYYMKTNKVQFSNNVPRNLRTPPIYLSELYSILVNVLSNALKAVYGQPERRIAVEAEKIEQILYIRMMDTGVGLPSSWRENREIAFRPFESKSLFNPVLGKGTGLGLKVVKDVLEIYAGTAQFIDVESPWSTCIELILPERG